MSIIDNELVRPEIRVVRSILQEKTLTSLDIKSYAVLAHRAKAQYNHPVQTDKRQLLSAAQQHQADVIGFLQDLICIPSVNGRDPESGVARRVVAEAERLRLAARLVVAVPERPNVLVELGEGPAGFALIGHLDTVAEGDHGAWRHPPFGGEIHAGWLYGRGVPNQRHKELVNDLRT
jgi:hypothetical protein